MRSSVADLRIATRTCLLKNTTRPVVTRPVYAAKEVTVAASAQLSLLTQKHVQMPAFLYFGDEKDFAVSCED